MKRVLITDSVHPTLIDRLSNAGYKCDYLTHYDNDEVERNIHLYHGIIINSKIQMNKAKLDKGLQLEFIGRLGSGMEIIDLPYAKGRGVECYNSPEGNRDAVGEHAIGLLLSLFNKVNFGDQAVRTKKWDREATRGVELKGKTVGIIGFGNTGKVLAQKLSGFEVNVLAYDKYLNNYGNSFAKEVGMSAIYRECDIVSLHLPLTNETKYMVDENWFNQFEKPVYFINTSRGKIIRTADLLDAIYGNKILGACLDVFENEKPHSFNKNEEELYNRLYNKSNVVLSPHVAGWTKESKYKLANVLANKILKGFPS